MTTAFNTAIEEQGDQIIGPLRSPKQMLASQEYDGHTSIHDDDTAKALGFQGGTIEGPTHFSQFAPLGAHLWEQQWFETGCISAHYRAAVFVGEDVRASVTKPAAGATYTSIRMEKADGTEVLVGTMSVGHTTEPTALETRLGTLKPLAEPAYARTSMEGNSLVGDRPLPEYKEISARMHDLNAEFLANGDDPSVVADTIVRAAKDSSPRARYPAGKMAKQISMLRRLVPSEMFDKSLRKQLGLPA